MFYGGTVWDRNNTLYGIGVSELKKKNGRQLKEEVFVDSITDGSNLVIARSISATKRAFFILLLKHSYLVAFSS